jgi:vacuolar-type H+-ATPase subunit F/Vma7
VKNVVFITPPDALPGFSMAGFIHFSPDRENLHHLLKQITDSHEFGIIVMDERLYDSSTEHLITGLEEQWDGVFILLPTPDFAVTTREDHATRLLRRAIGYQVRIER